jgi:hypothetical protein
MRFLSRLAKRPRRYKSVVERESAGFPGVTFTVRRMSFGRRLKLAESIRAIGAELEYREAGDELGDRVEATLIANRIDQIYLEWGLVEVRGLLIDGRPATRELLFGSGPEELTREVLAAIKAECGLTEQERKNS